MIVAWLAITVWVLLFGFNLLLTWSSGTHELIVGAAVTTLGTVFFVAFHRERARDLLVRPPLRVLLRPIPRLLSEAWQVGCVLCGVAMRGTHGTVGVIAVQPFREGRRDRRDAGRRGLVVLSGSVAPNGFALYLPEGGECIVLHRLVPQPVDPDREWPG